MRLGWAWVLLLLFVLALPCASQEVVEPEAESEAAEPEAESIQCAGVKGRDFRVGVRHCPPYTYCPTQRGSFVKLGEDTVTPEGCVERCRSSPCGYEIDLLNKIWEDDHSDCNIIQTAPPAPAENATAEDATNRNCVFRKPLAPDGKIIYTCVSDFEDLAAGGKNSECFDMMIGCISMKGTGTKDFVFSRPTDYGGLGVMVRRDFAGLDTKSPRLFFLNPFTWQVWLLLALVLAMVAAYMIAFERWDNAPKTKRFWRGTSFVVFRLFGESIPKPEVTEISGSKVSFSDVNSVVSSFMRQSVQKLVSGKSRSKPRSKCCGGKDDVGSEEEDIQGIPQGMNFKEFVGKGANKVPDGRSTENGGPGADERNQVNSEAKGDLDEAEIQTSDGVPDMQTLAGVGRQKARLGSKPLRYGTRGTLMRDEPWEFTWDVEFLLFALAIGLKIITLFYGAKFTETLTKRGLSDFEYLRGETIATTEFHTSGFLWALSYPQLGNVTATSDLDARTSLLMEGKVTAVVANYNMLLEQAWMSDCKVVVNSARLEEPFIGFMFPIGTFGICDPEKKEFDGSGTLCFLRSSVFNQRLLKHRTDADLGDVVSEESTEVCDTVLDKSTESSDCSNAGLRDIWFERCNPFRTCEAVLSPATDSIGSFRIPYRLLELLIYVNIAGFLLFMARSLYVDFPIFNRKEEEKE